MEVFHLLDVKLCLKKLQMKSEANIKGPLLKKSGTIYMRLPTKAN